MYNPRFYSFFNKSVYRKIAVIPVAMSLLVARDAGSQECADIQVDGVHKLYLGC